MIFTRSRNCATAWPRLKESSQKAPSAASDSVMNMIALTATRPARRRSLSASPSRKPNTIRSALVLHEAPRLQRERAPTQRGGQEALVGREQHGGPARPDVLHDVEDLGGHPFVQVAGGLVGDQQERLARDRARQRRPLRLAL